MKDYLTDEQYERLNWHEQRNYKWCSICESYYHIESNHTCNTERIEVSLNGL